SQREGHAHQRESESQGDSRNADLPAGHDCGPDSSEDQNKCAEHLCCVFHSVSLLGRDIETATSGKASVARLCAEILTPSAAILHGSLCFRSCFSLAQTDACLVAAILCSSRREAGDLW